jgi:hypothetical protein
VWNPFFEHSPLFLLCVRVCVESVFWLQLETTFIQCVEEAAVQKGKAQTHMQRQGKGRAAETGDPANQNRPLRWCSW